MKKLLLLLLAPLLLVSCSSDDDDVDNPDGFLAKNDGVVFLENIGPDEYYAFFWIFSPAGYTQGEVDPDDVSSCYSSGFQPWNVEIPGEDGGFDKYEVTENSSNTLKIKYTYSYVDLDFPEDNESGEANITLKLNGNVLTANGTDEDGETFTQTYYKADITIDESNCY